MNSFFFYDLETSGTNPRTSRIMQFGGQRTDMDLNPIGKSYNLYIKMTEDILPDPEAIMITGITPQKTLADGLTEAEFLKLFHKEIATPGTIFVGFNSVRFDDEFMRFLHYRNFYDPYEWQWLGDKSRWDLLDVSRMTRALRPEGILWPVGSDGKNSNKLELLASINKLKHRSAHDALSDVEVTIELAKLLKNKQPKLFDYLLNLRNKRRVQEVVSKEKLFVYTSGKYSGEFEKTTVVTVLSEHPQGQAVLVYDLRHDPEAFLSMSPEQIAEAWKYTKDETAIRLPVKTLKFNRCPAIAPLGVLNEKSLERLNIDLNVFEKHRQKLDGKFSQKVLKALEIMDKKRQTSLVYDEQDIDGLLYDDFFPKQDQAIMRAVRLAEPTEIKPEDFTFKDTRLKTLLPLYKARNYPKSLNKEEHFAWRQFIERKLTRGGEKSPIALYKTRIKELGQRTDLTLNQKGSLDDLIRWEKKLELVIN